MTNKVDFRTYLYLNHNQFIIYVAEILTNEKIYFEKFEIEENFTELKFSKLDEFLNFIKDKKIIIHNAEFDISHLNNELSIAGKPEINKEINI